MNRAWLRRNVLALGVVSLLTDLASEMALPLLPAFLGVLGGGALALGWIEGLAGAVASVLRLFSGRWADRCGRYRPFVIAGYGISSLVRPLLALAALPWHVAAVRMADRVGKGLRGSPRDAILAWAVRPEERGVAFGFHRAMDHAGAMLGPALAFLLLRWVTDDLRTIFWCTAIPGALAVLAVVLGVREPEPHAETPGEEPATEPATEPVTGLVTGLVTAPAKAPEAREATDPATRSGGRFAWLLLPLSLFSLGTVSDVFLLLLASAQRAPLVELPLLWIGLHLVKSLSGTPGGHLADRAGRRVAIGLGWGVHIAVFSALAFVEGQSTVRALILAYGLCAGLSEGAEKALVAEIAPSRKLGTAFGWYHLMIGGMTLLANVGFGYVWQAWGRPAAFLASAGVAATALACLVTLPLRRH